MIVPLKVHRIKKHKHEFDLAVNANIKCVAANVGGLKINLNCNVTFELFDKLLVFVTINFI